MSIVKKLLLAMAVVLVSGAAGAGDVLLYTGEGGLDQP